MGKTLGLDLGTNSIGWAIVEHKEDGSCSLLERGVNIFKDGVAHDQSGEHPAVQERTDARASRRHYFRRRLRKIGLLSILSEEKLCPPVCEAALKEWKDHKKYPMDADFLNWQRTDDNTDRNPYHDRYRCLTETLDLKKKADRYCLGRALYHLNQRRGFISNRKDASSADDGKVRKGISDLSVKMSGAGCTYLGEYFYKLYRENGKIRTTYTARDEHIRSEFDRICEMQDLDKELVGKLEKAIFYQRPLKSQKGLVGRCTFEKGKPRCQLSHPRFEEFRMLSFVNNIRVKSYLDDEYRALNDNERSAILPLFFRKSSAQFDFEDIARKIAGKNNYCFKDDDADSGYRFNYRMTTNVAGCPVSAAIISAISSSPESWTTDLASIYLKGEGKTEEQILNDVWHALMSFGDESVLSGWLEDNLQVGEKEARILAKARIPGGYASLSLKAVNKVLPYLRRGYRYDEAVFMGNIPSVLRKSSSGEDILKAESAVAEALEDFGKNPLNARTTKEKVVKDRLSEMLGIEKRYTDIIYHPSMIDVYQDAQPDADGRIVLGSPRTASVRNPMAMRALFRLRKLVNRLLEEGKIDRETKINIEFARGLNDSNKRAAIERYQREQEKENRKYAEEIVDFFKAEGKDITPTDTDILKYKLWIEQNKKCLYTGASIGVADFIGSGNRYDIEHTIPRSREGDDSQANKTLCDNRFNRDVKKGKIPSELANHNEVLARIEALKWQEKVDLLRKGIEVQKRKSRVSETKSSKDDAIRQMHYLKLQLDYWQGKLSRFKMKEVPQGFSNRQGVDIGIIGKYGKDFLKTVFPKVYIVKGATTADFRTNWGIQQEYTRKERVNHTHHCIDAITIACIDGNQYARWAQYNRDKERYLFWNGEKPTFEKPWPTFTEDVKKAAEELSVFHYVPDNMPKQTKKVLKVNGKIQTGADGKPLYVQGHSARAALHEQTFYGAIEKDGEIRYVIRKSLDSISETDITNIVDDVVRQKVLDAVSSCGNLKKAVEKGIWMNEEKRIPINKVRLYARNITNVSATDLKPQRDLSDKEYKRMFHVKAGGNYCIAIYSNGDGDKKPSFLIRSNLEAAKYFTRHGAGETIVPPSDSNGKPLAKFLKPGTMVLLYESSPEELKGCTAKELSERLYEVVGISISTVKQGERMYQYGMLSLRFNKEARPSSDYTGKKGVWKIGEDYRPLVVMNHSQLKCLVDGKDFTLSETGEIVFRP